MINFISGKILFKGENYLILEKGGIGFKIFFGEETLKKVKVGQTIKIFCYLCIRNERPELYGFLEEGQLKIFENLEKIPGIGPKIALKIASKGKPEDFKRAVFQKEWEYFGEIKGLGKKKLQKIILEISGNLEKAQTEDFESEKLLQALISLGFSKREAREAIQKLPKNLLSFEEKIKRALQFLTKG